MEKRCMPLGGISGSHHVFGRVPRIVLYVMREKHRISQKMRLESVTPHHVALYTYRV
ncbi:hypothetical protein X777_13071 [Ooceraea biroi]|uniref:Uncharacterized protein n=1 Tax=Ooceraea biroi TaxID=2015173 RepID=A0A026X0E6_OOCBI|nr:hypothetical protein X777_13071 [Ooceraea biroi]